jgi:hypothetical protein
MLSKTVPLGLAQGLVLFFSLIEAIPCLLRRDSLDEKRGVIPLVR